MQTILAAGSSAALDEAARLNFTHVILPASLFSPSRDLAALSAAAERGLSVYFGTGPAMVANYGAQRWMNALTSWRNGVTAVANFAGVFVAADADVSGVSLANYLSYIADLRAHNITSVSSFGFSVLNGITTPADWLGKADYEGLSCYSMWGGDGSIEEEHAESDFTDAYDDFIAAIAAASPAVTLGAHVWLQGFYDRKWGETDFNGYPLSTHYEAMTGHAAGVTTVPFAGAACYAYAARPRSRDRIKALAQWGKYHSDGIGYNNGALLSRIYVKPSSTMVRYGESVYLDCTISTAGFALTTDPGGCRIGETSGVFTAGNTTGTAVVTASVSGTSQTFDVTIQVYNEP